MRDECVDVQLLTGDALDVLPDGLPPGRRPNFILADPPWNCGKLYGEQVDDNLPEALYRVWLQDLYSACHEVAAEDATLYAFCPVTHLLQAPSLARVHLPSLLKLLGWKPKQLLIWYRPNGVGPRHRAPGQAWANMCEYVVLATKGEGAPVCPSGLPEGERQPWYHNVLTVNTPQGNHPGGRWHPCQKPVRLYELLIRAHRGVTRVLDPTCGSGSSLLACQRLGIPAVGIEIEPATVEIAGGRLAAERHRMPYAAWRAGHVPLFATAEAAENAEEGTDV